ncbi:cohesin domain-containing protein [Cryocola sp. 340MFSha3.1]|uniref:cohesin domain-containing protein n=1 Tax=Cryocola sp. 340MFSha3.1 TaxID=1169145 RepID=UPI001E2FF2A0|nr:cohesin domain-containing protein [Cryocola sp. 340MFSha3.1]
MHHTPRRLVRLLAAAAAALAGLGLAVGAAAPAVAAPAVTGTTVSAPSAVTAGDSFTVTVTLTGATDVFGYEAVLAFDPAVVAYVDGSAVVPAGGYDAVATSSGTVDVVYTRLGTSPALSGTIAYTLTFTAKAAGSTAFTLRSLSLVDPASAVTPLSNAAVSPAVVVSPASVPGPPTGSGPSTGSSPGSGSGSGAATSSSASTSDDDLASTGSDVAPYLIAGAVLVVLGAAVVLIAVRRRRAGEAR